MRKNKVIEEVKPEVVKVLFSEVPVGSVFFGNYSYGGIYRGNNFIVSEKLGDFEQPTYEEYNNYSRITFMGENIPTTTTDTIGYYRYVDYNDLMEYGMGKCIRENKYKILDLDYIRQVKAIRNCKTLKELKITIENGMR